MLLKKIMTSIAVFVLGLVVFAGCNKAEDSVETTKVETEVTSTTTAIVTTETDVEDEVVESEIIEETTISLSQKDSAWRSYIRTLNHEDALKFC